MEIIPTNTVVICQLLKEDVDKIPDVLNSPEILPGLVEFAKIKFMRRVLALFDSIESAERALPIIKQRIYSSFNYNNIHMGYSIASINKCKNGEAHLHIPTKGKLESVTPPMSPLNEFIEELKKDPHSYKYYPQDLKDLCNVLTQANCEHEMCNSSDILARDSKTRIVTITPSICNCPAILVTQESLKKN